MNIVDKILSDVCLDERVVNGTFDIEKNEHILVLKEYLENKGIPEEMVLEFVNLVVEKGKYPERQAWNKNGLLVTFPTPAYKQRAIQKGTHFEKKPVPPNNLFPGSGGQQAPVGPAPAPDAAAPAPAGQGTALPPSDTSQSQTPPAQPETPDPGTPGTTAPSAGGGAGPTAPPAQGTLPAAPVAPAPAPAVVAPPPTPPTPPPAQKSPLEIEAEKAVIKQMLDTSDTLPTQAGVGGVGITEELKKLVEIAKMMNLNEAVKFLSTHI